MRYFGVALVAWFLAWYFHAWRILEADVWTVAVDAKPYVAPPSREGGTEHTEGAPR